MLALRRRSSTIARSHLGADDGVVLLGFAAADIGVALAEPESTERISLTDSDGEADDFSTIPALSGDGRFVAFQSVADNLVAGDTNSAHDVFVRDRVSGTTTRVSVSTGGGEADANSGFVFGSLGSLRIAISDDGRFVAFASQADNLVAGDTNDAIDIFVHDRQTAQRPSGSASPTTRSRQTIPARRLR